MCFSVRPCHLLPRAGSPAEAPDAPVNSRRSSLFRLARTSEVPKGIDTANESSGPGCLGAKWVVRVPFGRRWRGWQLGLYRDNMVAPAQIARPSKRYPCAQPRGTMPQEINNSDPLQRLVGRNQKRLASAARGAPCDVQCSIHKAMSRAVHRPSGRPLTALYLHLAFQKRRIVYYQRAACFHSRFRRLRRPGSCATAVPTRACGCTWLHHMQRCVLVCLCSVCDGDMHDMTTDATGTHVLALVRNVCICIGRRCVQHTRERSRVSRGGLCVCMPRHGCRCHYAAL